MKRLLAILLSLVFLVSPVSASSSISDDANYYHPYPTNLKPGDIVIGHSPDVDKYIPGYWTHVGIVGWYDPDIGDWIIIEAYYPEVRLTPLREFMKRYDAFAVLRIKTTDEVRYRAVYFAYYQLGKPYDFNYFKKPEVFDDKYYCSQLVWASYMWASNYTINIDANDGSWSWKYGYAVAPQEVYDDPMTYVIYYHHV